MTVSNEIEFALREVVVAIDHLVEVTDRNRNGYDKVPDSLHHAILTLMREIEVMDWEVLG